MGLIKVLATGCHYSDKWLQTEDTLTGSKGKDGEKGKQWQRAVPGGAYHFAQVNRQLFNHHTESPELPKHAGDVFARQTTDRLDIWMEERGKKRVKDFKSRPLLERPLLFGEDRSHLWVFHQSNHS